MHHLMMNLPVFGTFGVVALLAGPLAGLSIDSGAWVLERCVYVGPWVLAAIRHARIELPGEDDERLKRGQVNGLPMAAYIRQAALRQIRRDETEGGGV